MRKVAFRRIVPILFFFILAGAFSWRKSKQTTGNVTFLVRAKQNNQGASQNAFRKLAKTSNKSPPPPLAIDHISLFFLVLSIQYSCFLT